MSRFTETLDRLVATIATRQGVDPSGSYTAQLLADPSRAAKKLGEEAVETVIAAASGDKDAIAAESADLIYHWLVLLAASGVSLDAVAKKLVAREGRSGLDETASRKPSARSSSPMQWGRGTMRSMVEGASPRLGARRSPPPPPFGGPPPPRAGEDRLGRIGARLRRGLHGPDHRPRRQQLRQHLGRPAVLAVD